MVQEQQEQKVSAKYLRIGPYELCALAIVLLAALIRIALLRLDWPLLDSDEGTMGLMAMHIAYRGEHPIFFYGQGYMGAFEAYVAAFFFHLFGVSSFTLRIGLVLMYCVFLFGMYLLTSRLYSKKLALFTLLLLALGSNPLLNRELVAVGGDPETLLCGPFLLLIPIYLALDYSSEEVKRRRWQRLLAYTLWGLLAGFGLWSHMLTAPFILFGGILLLLFCWRELFGWPLLLVFVGFMVCTALQIKYNLDVPPDRSSLFYLLNVLKAGGTPQLPKHILIPMQIKGSLLITLPTATGANPLCAPSAVHALRFGSLHDLHCTLVHTGWSTGIILLWLSACLFALYALWQLWFHARPWHPETRQSFVIQCSRLSLLLAGALPVVLYMASPNSAFFPVATARYLIGLLVCTPAILWPLWRGAQLIKPLLLRRGATLSLATRGEQFMGMLNRALLLGILAIFALGTFSTFTGIPAQPPLDPQQDVYFTQNSTQHLDVPLTQQFNHQESTLIATLLHDRLTRIYSDYWSCDRLIFRSREQIACSALRERLELGHNRYEQYRRLVEADPHPTYVFHADSWPDHTLEQLLASGEKKYQSYQRFVVAGYAVYRSKAAHK
jgi:Dolichyl-phosphate-mannose-protein mannosyltransferase